MDTTITENTYSDVLREKFTPGKILPKLTAPVTNRFPPGGSVTDALARILIAGGTLHHRRLRVPFQ